MQEEKCFRCLKSERIVRLLDAIYENEIVKICEECALLEDIPIIRKPSSFQLKESERPYTVQERLARMSGIKFKNADLKIEKRVEKEEIQGITLDKLRKPKDYSQILKHREERARKLSKPINLIDNYNWYMQRARRARKMTLAQLGAIIAEPETTLKMVEDGLLPDDAGRIVGKIEQFFKINLRKSEAEKERARIEAIKPPARVLSFDEESLKNLTIYDLRKLKEQEERIQQEEDKELASKIAWQGKSKEEREKEKEEEIKKEEQPVEMQKSRKSFWDIFKSKKEEKEEDVFVQVDTEE